MQRIIREGYTIRLSLPEQYGYGGYSIRCTYKYNRAREKYLLSMWLRREDIDDDFRIEAQEIDAQYISGTRETIEDNIFRVVEQACINGYLDHYIKRFEYTCKCFECGNERYELEALAKADHS